MRRLSQGSGAAGYSRDHGAASSSQSPGQRPQWRKFPGTAGVELYFTIIIISLKAHVHPSGYACLCFCFGTVHLLNAVF